MRDKAAKLILNVDDRAARRAENSRILRENNFEVVEIAVSETGELPPAQIAGRTPAVILLGDTASVLSGFIENEHFRRNTLLLQIVSPDFQSGTDKPIDAFLKEPYSPRELLAQVNLLLRLHGTERQTAERETLIQNIVQTSSSIFYIYNIAARRSEYLTPRASEILGYTAAELKAFSDDFIEKLMHPDDVSRIAEHFSKLEKIPDGEILEFDYRIRHKSGEWLWFRSRDNILARSPGGAPERVLGIASNITFQKQAARQNLIQEERYEAFVRQSTEGIWRLELDGEVPTHLSTGEQVELAVRHAYLAECNDAMAQMYGFEKAEQLVGSRLTDLFDLTDPANFDYFRSFIDSGYRLTGAESHEIDASGNDKYFLNSLIGVTENDKLVRLWGTQIDITRQKQIEEALRRSETRYRELFNSIDEGFCICEMIVDETGIPYDYRFLEVNRMFVELTGLQNPIGKTARQLVPDLEAHWFEIYGRVALTGEALRFIQGSEAMGRWFDVYAFRPGEPEERKFALIFRNITERKRTEEALLAAERRATEEYQQLLSRIVPLAQALGTARDLSTIYRRILEFVCASMPCIAFFVSFYESETNRRLAAYAWSERQEIDISELPPISLSPDGDGANERAVFTGKTQIVDNYMETVRSRPHIILQENGVAPQSAAVVPMVVMGRVTGTLEVQASENNSFHAEHIVALEMAANLAAAAIENVRLLESEARARRSAEAATHAKDEFIALVSHELRSPLSAMLGWARILQNPKIQETDKKQAIETIIRNARAQSKLIEDLLDTARISSGKLRLDLRQVDLRQVVQAALDVLKPAAEAKKIRFTNIFDQNIDTVEGDADRLQQIVGNLLSNAVKFTPSGGSIEISLKRQNFSATITVKDSGVGIAPEFLPQIFEQFTQSDPASARRSGGLGIGLALARRLAEMHGGTISAESAGLGRGSTFTVTLPLRFSPPFIDNVKSQAGYNMTSEGKLKNLWVLIVDDEADARDMVSFMLKINGARVTTAGSAVEAMEFLQNIGELAPTPDVIVSDIGMPDEDGYALIQKIRALPSAQSAKIPAIALTAFNRPEDKRSALDAGFQMHLGKPIEPENLISAIGEVAAGKVL